MGEKLKFYGGPLISLIPLLSFLFVALISYLQGASDIRGMWAGAVLGLIISLFLARDKDAAAGAIIEGMASRLALLPISCWLFAGIFAGALKSSGLVEGIVWLAFQLQLGGGEIALFTFIASALLATATGTGVGTTISGMTVLYPAGVILGGDPALLAGSIIAGGAFGDNIAAISDTTICSAATQNADIAGVVKSRVPYALVAAGISALFIVFAGNSGHSGFELSNPEKYMDPTGLFMLGPAIFTIVLSWRGIHIIAATTAGTVATLFFSSLLDLTSPGEFLFFGEGQAGGVLIESIAGIVDLSFLTILLLACIRIMQKGGGDRIFLDFLIKRIKTVGEAEMAIITVALFFTTIMTINAPPILAAGIAFVRPLGEKFKIHPYRRANLLDATACTLVYSLPWSPSILLAVGISSEIAKNFSQVPPLGVTDILPHIYYCFILLIVIVAAALTGWGRRFIEDS